MMQVPSRRESTSSRMMPRSKPRTLVVEAVIPEVSKDVQKQKNVGGIRVAQGAIKACRDSRIVQEDIAEFAKAQGIKMEIVGVDVIVLSLGRS